MHLLRLLKIIRVSLRYGLDEFFLGHERVRGLRTLLSAVLFWRRLKRPRGERLRLALEALGPIFVKFGQVLSTRRDLMPLDIADELAKLQDQVPPFPVEQAYRTLERTYNKPVDQVFEHFDPVAIASASVAQVHFAVLPGGREVAVKVLRPGIAPVIDEDVALLNVAAGLIEKLWADGRRLKPREVIAEFERHLKDELDLMREAANASQLRRNFDNSPLLLVPEIVWDFCGTEVMVMERMTGVPISQVGKLRALGIDIPKLARAGVEIFFTQVFRDGFFHADMHPGNILVAADGRYIALDFGIMGTLNEVDKNYLAQNFLAFFRRDYRRVARAYIEAGWVPAGTRLADFEAAVRSVCEPVFDKPLKDISFGKVLVRLFEIAGRFGIEVQPQLVLLQKTLLQIEGLGRQLDPDLDLRPIAQPVLERFMREQLGWRGMLRGLRDEAPLWARTLPQIPRLVHRVLSDDAPRRMEMAIRDLERAQVRQTRAMWVIVAVLIVLTAVIILR